MRAVLVRLPARKLREALSLPDGVTVVGMRYDWEADAIVMRIEGPDLPRVAEGAVPPTADLVMGHREDREASKIVVFPLLESAVDE